MRFSDASMRHRASLVTVTPLRPMATPQSQTYSFTLPLAPARGVLSHCRNPECKEIHPRRGVFLRSDAE